jgi:hypothetical protein
MTMIVVGGHSRKVGKTAVSEALIRAFRQYPWTAIKISSHWHADPAVADDYLIHEESSGKGRDSDSARYLAAGASRAFWVQVRPHRLAEAMPSLLPIFQSSPFVIVESNALPVYMQPDIYLMVLRCDVDEFKESARETLGRAHAIVSVDSGMSIPAWKDGVRAAMAGIPIFTTQEPGNLPAGLVGFIKSRLGI